MEPMRSAEEVLIKMHGTEDDDIGILSDPKILETIGVISSMMYHQQTFEQLWRLSDFDTFLHTDFNIESQDHHSGYVFSLSLSQEGETQASVDFLLVNPLLEEECDSVLKEMEVVFAAEEIDEIMEGDERSTVSWQ